MVQEPENPSINIVKIETDNDTSDNEENDKCVEIIDTTDSTHSTAQPYQIGTGQESNSLSRSSTLLRGTAAALNNSSPPASENRYCNVCDIKFKYLNSYIAHKESYCRNSTNDLDIGGSNPATSVIATTCSSPNQTSVVT